MIDDCTFESAILIVDRKPHNLLVNQHKAKR